MNAPSVTVTGNTIFGCGTGISIGCWGSSFNNAVQVVMDNLITNCTDGIILADWESGSTPVVENNTITGNIYGICVSYPWGNNAPILNATIMSNNIGGNAKYDFQNQQPTTVNAPYNWWGTTDTQAISQTIYDYYDDFNVGAVTYYPFLTLPNPFAPVYGQPPIITPTPTPTLTPTPNFNSTPAPQYTPTPAPIPTPTTNTTSTPTTTPTPTQTPQNQSTLLATTDQGAIITLPTTGNITSTQVSNFIIATNESADTTILSFPVAGQNGTEGFSNLTIAKSSIPYGKTPAIYIDSQLAQNQGYTQDQNNFYVWYTTHFSTHQITIKFAATTSVAPSTVTPFQSNTDEQITELEIIIGVAVAVISVLIVVVALFAGDEQKNFNKKGKMAIYKLFSQRVICHC